MEKSISHFEQTLDKHMKPLFFRPSLAAMLVAGFCCWGKVGIAEEVGLATIHNWLNPWAVSAGLDASICQGGSTQLQATGASTYTWSPAVGLSCTDCPNPLASPSVTTTYFVVGDDGTTDEVVVNVLAPPVITNVGTNNPTDCSLPNGSIAVTIQGGTGPFEYSIDGGNIWQNNGIFTALNPGNYVVKVRGVNGICVVDGGTFTLKAPTPPQVLNVVKIDPTFCDVPNGSIIVSAAGGVSPLQYSIDNGQTWQTQNTFQLLGSGNYQIKVRNANGTCVTNAGLVTLSASPDEAIIADIFTSSPSNCGETDGLITLIVPNSGGQFEFSVNGGLDYQASNSFTNLVEGIYHIVVRRTDGTCTKDGGFVTLSSANRPTIYGVSKVDPQTCGSQTGNITILAFGPSTLQFSIDGGATWQSSNIFPNLAVGTYQIAVQNSDGSCTTNGGTATLLDFGPPVINSVTHTSPTACGLNDGSISISASGHGQQLEYSINNGVSWQNSTTFNNLAGGSYQVRVRFLSGSCPVDYANNPVILTSPGNPPVISSINLTQPSACGVQDGRISISASGSGPLSYSINGGASFQPFSVFNNLAAGSYQIIVKLASGNCSTSGTAQLFYTGCTDTLLVNIASTGTSNYCIDPSVFNNLGTPTAAGFCGQGNVNTVSALAINQNCVTLSPAPGYTGVSPDLICTVHCFNNSNLCDTTYLQVNVLGVVNCDDVFVNDTVTINYIGNPTNYCVPVPLTNLLGYNLFLNGTQFSNPFACEYEPTTAYSFTFLPGAGFSGPYSLDSWAVNSNTYTGFFNDANELLTLMQVFDPSGNWQIDLGAGLIYGGNSNSTYGDMKVTHLPSGSQTILNTNTTFLPTGFTVGITNPGISILVVQEPITGCADTLYINAELNPITTDTIYLTTTTNTPTTSTCLDASELPGGVIAGVGYCGGPSYGGAPLSAPTCVYYVPNLGFAGQDQFCMVACDGGFPQICDTTIFIINVLSKNDTVYLTIPAGETSLDTCLNGFVIQLPSQVTSTNICGINNSQIGVTASANCLNFDANGTFFGTTTVCVNFCAGGVCDQNTFIVTIVPPVVCEDIFPQNSLSFTSPTPDNPLCLPIPIGEIVGYNVTVDGVANTQSFVPCDFDNLVLYSTTTLPAGPLTVNAWTANGMLHSGTVSGLNDLVATLNIWDPNGDWSLNVGAQTIQGGRGGIYSSLVITPAGGTQQTLVVNLAQFALGSQLTVTGYGTHEIIVTAANGCADTLQVTFNPHSFSTDTLVFNTTPNTTVSQICGNTSELVGNLSSVSACELTANGAFVSTSTTCFSYTPNIGFIGQDVACVVFCDDNLVPVCDTFVFVINVQPQITPCPEIFNPSEIFTSLQNGVGEVCLPLTPTQMLDYQISLDGQPYGGSLTPCDIDQVYVYSYSQVFGQGANGPYSVSWTANGQNFSSVVQNMQALVAQMNAWDFTGNWTIEQPTFSIISTNDNGVYGNLIITHIATGILSTLAPSFNSVPSGTAVQINGAGQHTLLVESQVDGCQDTLTIHALNGVAQLDILTAESTPSNVNCIDTTGLPGNFQGLAVCQAPQNGTINIVGNCFTFTPDAGFVGTNTGCVVVCDNLGNCDSTLLNITVTPLCSLFDIFPDTTLTFHVVDCSDIAGYCTPILLDSIGNYGVLDNGFPYNAGFVVCNGQFAQIALDTGFHELVFVQFATGCQDTLRANVTCTTNNGCGTIALSPLTLEASDCNAVEQFCVSVSVLDLPNFLITDNGAAFNGTIGICDLNGTTVGMALDTGQHVLILADTVKGCADTFTVNVLCTIIEDVTVDTTVAEGNSLVFCLEDYGYLASTIDSVVSVCLSNGNTSFTIDPNTWCITVLGETVGLDTACFQVFVGDTSAIFTVNIEVTAPCPVLIPGGIFATGVPCGANTATVCLPFNFLDLVNKKVLLDGQAFTGPYSSCGVDSTFILNYNALPSQGSLGPYIIVSWSINGSIFTGSFNTIQELAAQMNTWDPTGNWQIVFDPFSGNNLIQGGDQANTYGGMSVEQQLTGINVVLGINTITVPTGVSIELPVGSHSLTITDTVSLCTETAILEMVCLTSDTVETTISLGAQDTFCLDLSELVGTPISATNICAGSNGEVVSFTIDGNFCVIYEGNEPGLDSACVLVCDEAGLCDTTYFFITVDAANGLPPIAVDDDDNLTNEGQASVIEVLENDTVQALLDLVIITQPQHGEASEVSNGINYVPDPGYCDEDIPDSFTYAICNPFGCDTATVSITVLCDDVQIYNAFSPNNDNSNETFKITGLQAWPNHHLTVFNRWGVVVYESSNYLSDWGGTYKDKLLPDGTYFYVLELGNGGETKKGYVVILR